MRGEERRITSEGRRSADRHRGPPPWLRIAILALALAITAHVLLVARSINRPMAAASGPLGGISWSELWVLGPPILIGLFTLALVLHMQRRQQGISREWAASERRFRGAVEAARCGVWEWDTETDQVTVSDYMAELMGLDRSGPIPSDEILARIHPRYHDAVLHALRQAQTFGAFDVSFPVPDPQGRARWIDARGQARGDRGDDGFTSVLGVARWTPPRPAAPRPRPRRPRAGSATASKACPTPSSCSTNRGG